MQTAAKQYWKWGAILAGAAAFLALLFFFAPDRHAFYPRCVFYSLTGLQCPGCGGLRAAHHLMHGDLAVAFRYHPLFVALAPLLIGGAAWRLVSQRKGGSWANLLDRPAVLWLILAGVVAFAVLRNLPFGPLAGIHL